MTVSQVFGCGLQKRTYRSLSWARVCGQSRTNGEGETVVCDVPVDLVMDTARDTLQTGEVGDGKIFVYDVEDSMRIRPVRVVRRPLLMMKLN